MLPFKPWLEIRNKNMNMIYPWMFCFWYERAEWKILTVNCRIEKYTSNKILKKVNVHPKLGNDELPKHLHEVGERKFCHFYVSYRYREKVLSKTFEYNMQLLKNNDENFEQTFLLWEYCLEEVMFICIQFLHQESS